LSAAAPAAPERKSSFWRHRDLVLQLARREVVGKYRGSFLGLLWSFFHPLVMLGIYTFVFTQVFNARWTEGETTTGFAMALFVGLIMHGFLGEGLARAPHLVLGNPSYVTKVVFPLEVLTVASVLAALFHALASTAVFVLVMLALGRLPPTAALFPLVLAPLALQALGWSWLFSGVAVYVRDVGQMVGLLVTALLFLSPVFFPLQTLPASLQTIARFNPLTIPIEQARRVLMWGEAPQWTELGIYAAASVLIAFFGLAAFHKLRRGFADVL
jgi:lipopolysaccharide transport system permease protein